jgi:hypothetical protein
MPPIGNERSDTRIQSAGSVPALPRPEAEMGHNCSASPSGEDGGNDQ